MKTHVVTKRIIFPNVQIWFEEEQEEKRWRMAAFTVLKQTSRSKRSMNERMNKDEKTTFGDTVILNSMRRKRKESVGKRFFQH